MTVYFSDMENYGKDIDIEIMFAKYRIYFDGKYSPDQVIAAIHAHCEKSNIVPKVADLTAILNPEKPKITDTEYIAAKKRWHESDYNPFSRDKDIVKAYEAQSIEKTKEPPITCPNTLELVNKTVKRIS